MLIPPKSYTLISQAAMYVIIPSDNPLYQQSRRIILLFAPCENYTLVNNK